MFLRIGTGITDRCIDLIGVRRGIGGYYILVIYLGDRVVIKRGGWNWILDEGVYFYIGSARRDLLHRVLRHYRSSKKLFWHIDYLLANPSTEIKYTVLIIPLKLEVDLESYLAWRLRGFFEGVKGFGCSDKRGDYSHLYRCSWLLDECIKELMELLSSDRILDDTSITVI